MSSIMQILRRIGGAKMTPTSGSAGQLALWKAGTAPTDAASLYAHDGTQWVELLDTSRNPRVITANDAVAGLRITQTGTGEALRIEDEANPDASPFVVDQNGNVGIGGGASTFKVSVATQGIANFSGFYINGPAAANDEAGLLRVITSNQTATNVVAMFGTTTSKILTVASDGMVLVSGPGKFGYGTSAGGAVVQTGSKSTMVPLDRVSGRVAMHAEVMNTNQVVNFGIINNKIAAEDVVIVNISGGVGNGAIYNLQVNNVTAGAVYLRLVCTSPGPIGEPVQFNFVVIKGSHN